MINFRKGTGYSLQQTDKAVPLPIPNTPGTFVAGMVARQTPAGPAAVGISGTPLTDSLGFVGLNDTDTSVISSGNLLMYFPDGNTVVETDQTASAITATNYPIGANLTANSAGLIVVSTATTDHVIGQVYDNTATLPTLTNVTGTNGQTFQVQGFVNVLSIKLKA